MDEVNNQDLFDYACHLIRAGNKADAFPALEKVLAMEPTDVTVLRVYAELLASEKRHEEAIPYFRQALAIQPTNGAIWGALGVSYGWLGELDVSRTCYDTALRYAPCHPDVHWNRSLNLLINGEWPRGWDEYQWGTVNRQKRVRTLQPEWDGKPYPQGTLLLWGEQGFGDTIQFLQLITPQVRESFKHIVLEVQRDLVPLLTRQPFLAGIQIIETQDDNSIPVEWDEHAGLMSLPSILGLRVEDLPLATYYIESPDRTQGIQERQAGELRVGICWKGNPAHPNDYNRSLTPDDIDPLRKVEGIRWVCLQQGNLMHPHFKAEQPTMRSWADTANVLQTLDLVITCDTGIAHLAGAMGKECWILLPYVSDFRWLRDREDSPFYPSVRLFRQEMRGEWAGVIKRVTEALRERLKPATDARIAVETVRECCPHCGSGNPYEACITPDDNICRFPGRYWQNPISLPDMTGGAPE